MKKTKILAALLALVMLLSCLVLPISADDTGAGDNRILKATDKFGPKTAVSMYATPTIDGTMDTGYTEIGLVESTHCNKSSDASFDIYYLNDGNYLYFFLKVTADSDDDTDFQNTEVSRLYIDFLNNHDTVTQSGTNSAYMNVVTSETSYAGGQFNYVPNGNSSGQRGAADKVGAKGTDYVVNKYYKSGTDADYYTIEARIPFPQFVKDDLSAGKQPVISIAYEIRKADAGDGKAYQLGAYDATKCTKSVYNSVRWGDFTVGSDIVLCADPASYTNVIPSVIEDKTVAKINKGDITIDGVADDAGWNDAPYFFLDTEENTKATSEKYDYNEVRLSTDGEYLYILVTADTVQKRVYLNFAFDAAKNGRNDANKGHYIETRVGDGSASDCSTYYLYNTSGNYVSGDALYPEHSEFIYTKPESTKCLEMKIKLPDYVASAMAAGREYAIKTSFLTRNGSYNLRPSEGFSWQTAAVDVILPCEPVGQDGAGVANVIDKTVTVDGVMGADEGWSENATFNLTQNIHTAPASAKAVSTIRYSTDGANLYVFVRSPIAVQRYYLNFAFDAAKNGRDNANKDYYLEFATNNGSLMRAKYSNDAEIGYSEGDALYPEYAIKTEGDVETFEMKIALPDTVKGALTAGDYDIYVSCMVQNDTLKYRIAPDLDGDGKNDKNNQTGMAEDFEWQKGAIKLTLPKVADTALMGLQTTDVADGKYDIRFAALMQDCENFDTAGFKLTYVDDPDDRYDGQTAYEACGYVYTAINADGEKVNASDLGGQYFFCFTLQKLDVNKTYSFDITPYVTKGGQTDMLFSKTVRVTFTVDASGNVTLG